MKSGETFSGNWILEASEKLGVPLQRWTQTQAVGPCPSPKCRKEGEDRFVVFVEGNFWCRQCNHKGWWTEDRLEKSALRKIEEEKRAKQRELFNQMHQCVLWKEYNRDPDVEEMWIREGKMGIDVVERWGLGYCRNCPCNPDHESLTIPVWYKGKLFDIRHRIIDIEDGQGKYRSHLPGISPLFFNLDCVASARTLYVVEGEKKVIKATGAGLDCVIGYPGINYIGRLPNLLQRYQRPEKVIFLPDPGSENKVSEVVRKLPVDCFMVELWEKPDDFIDLYGKSAFQDALRIPTPL